MQLGPLTEDLIEARAQLLQEALRPASFCDYGIEAEYPIVLDPQAGHLSYCFYEERLGGVKELAAHANLWPRTLVHRPSGETFPVGLVGNVATAARWRGCGIMSQMLTEMWQKAQAAGLQALILWSDLVAFYHKLGFNACGTERRCYFAGVRLAASDFYYEIASVRPSDVDDPFLAELLAKRYPSPAHLARSLCEYRRLLGIPDTVLLVVQAKRELVAYGIVGKGFDMVGIVHEWGAVEPRPLLALLRHIAIRTDWPELGLLAPMSLGVEWYEAFAPYLCRQELESMALVKTEPGARVREVLSEGFLWGLDAI